MQNRPYAGLIAKAALLYFTLSGVCQNVRAQSDIHFRVVHNSLIIVSVMAGEEGPFDFVLDTGADTSVVDPSIAARLSRDLRGPVEQTTLAGVQSLARVLIGNLAIGSAEAKDLPVLVQDLSELRKIDSRIVGIAGEDFLERFNYMLDYDKHVVRFERATEIDDSVEGKRLEVEAGENRLLIGCDAQARNHAHLHLLLDSGATSVVLLRGASRLLDIPTQTTGFEITSGGQIGLQVGLLHELMVGTEKFRNLPAALATAKPSEDVGDGLLPTALFHAVYINSREHFVIVNPRIKRIGNGPGA
jgi:predicted aspartyl protease